MTNLSQEHFDEKIVDLHSTLKKRFDAIDHRFDNVESVLAEHTAQLIAIMESVSTRQELRNLVRELKAQGVDLDENKIFAA